MEAAETVKSKRKRSCGLCAAIDHDARSCNLRKDPFYQHCTNCRQRGHTKLKCPVVEFLPAVIQPAPPVPSELVPTPDGPIHIDTWVPVNLAMPREMLDDIDRLGPRSETLRQLILLGLAYIEIRGPIETYPLVKYEEPVTSVRKLYEG